MGVGGQRRASAVFTPGKESRYEIKRSLGGTQSRCGWVQKTSPPWGFKFRSYLLKKDSAAWS